MYAPKVTIGLPVYNGEKYIAEAIESLLAQSYTAFELLICDNASTDDTLNICNSYADKDSRIQVITASENKGAAWNYNRSVAMARGEYFRWQSHDDKVSPDALSECVDALDQHRHAVLAFPKTILIDAQGQHIGLYHDRLHLKNLEPSVRFSTVLYSIEECNAVFGLIRTDILKKTPLIGNYIASDVILLAELALYGQFLQVTDGVFYRRDHEYTSLRAHDNDADLVNWFDTSLGVTQQKPRKFLKWIQGYLYAIYRSDIPRPQKIKCCVAMLRWINWHKGKIWSDITA